MTRPLIILTGPTAVGKTDLSISLAQNLCGEIISADSMQVYRGMDIGTAKIKKEEMRGIPHHLIDILDPTEAFSAAAFKKLGKEAAEDIASRGHIPVVAGGTGFYIQALLYDVDFDDGQTDEGVRGQLEKQAAEEGADKMHALLGEKDPESAAAIPAQNVKRVLRALEYFTLTGEKISERNARQRKLSSPYNFCYYVLNCDRDLLYRRIDDRVDKMLAEGLLKEVQSLLDLGLDPACVAMQGLGYRQLAQYIAGNCSLEKAVEEIKKQTRHFAKRQLTWFRRERDVKWVLWEDFSFDKEKALDWMLSDIRKTLGI